MQFSPVALLAVFTTSASAAPSSAYQDPSEIVADAVNLTINGCAIVKCAAALGPAAVGCAIVAIEMGSNAVNDFFCIAMALNAAINVPTACTNCTMGPQNGLSATAGSAISSVASPRQTSKHTVPRNHRDSK